PSVDGHRLLFYSEFGIRAAARAKKDLDWFVRSFVLGMFSLFMLLRSLILFGSGSIMSSRLDWKERQKLRKPSFPRRVLQIHQQRSERLARTLKNKCRNFVMALPIRNAAFLVV